MIRFPSWWPFKKRLPKSTPNPRPVPPPIVAPPATPPHSEANPRTLLFIASSTLLAAKQPPAYWRGLGFTGLICLVDDGGPYLYDPALDPAALVARCQAVRDAAGDLELFLSHWGNNNVGPGRFLMPWDDDAAWDLFARNLAVLSSAAVTVKAAGVLMDAELEGGVQDPAVCWSASPRVAERARQYASALRSAGPLVVGHYVTFGFEFPLPAYVPFWRAVEAAAPGSLMLAEDAYLRLDMDYAGNRAAIRSAIGCESLGAVSLREKGPDPVAALAKAVPLARAGSPAGIWFFEWLPGTVGSADAALQAAIRAALGASR